MTGKRLKIQMPKTKSAEIISFNANSVFLRPAQANGLQITQGHQTSSKENNLKTPTSADELL